MRQIFTSFLTFSLIGCLNLYLHVDCHRELLLVSVSLGSAFRIKTTCAEGDECEGDQGALQEIFLEPLTAWIMNQINVVVKAGIHLPSLIGYPCDSCEQTVYLRRRAYCGCRLKYVHK
uniref:Uncharacterized protein n=1 Tax=Sphaerodactylus townsendi TaxID=933632 RepID=A0ACB8F751_9SAUR